MSTSSLPRAYHLPNPGGNIMSTRACAAVLALTIVPAIAAAEPSVADKMDRWLNESGYSGSVLVAKDGAVVLRKGYGKADREKGRPYTPETVYTIGSITKQFTAAAILKLEMQGKLKVEDPISKYVQGVPEDKRGITLHHLLTHSAGLDSDFAGDYDAVGRDEYVKRILASKLRSAPGTEYFYANSGYSLLGAIVEIVSGQPYETYLRANLFTPSGMTDTGYLVSGRAKEREAVGYQDGTRWGRLSEKPWGTDGPYWALRANGGILSTVDDMYKWHLALEGDAVLSAAAKKKMYAKQISEGPGGDSYYGYGWAIAKSPWGSREIGHNGGNRIFSADFRWFPDDKIVVITSSNDAGSKAWRAAEALARIAHGDDVPVSKGDAGGATTPLGTAGRHAIARGWLDAYNSGDPTAMAAFRAQHAAPKPGGPSDEERAKMLARMHGELGTLTTVGVTAEDASSITVRTSSTNGPTVTLRFLFVAEGKLDSVGVEVGD